MSKTGTKTPLRILVLPPVTRWKEELAELEAAGHIIYPAYKESPVVIEDYDLIIGRAAWHADNVHRPYLAKAVAAAQARLKAKKAKETED